MKTLDELANLYNTDKGTTYGGHSVHGYAPIYDKVLSPLREKPIRMLEVGVCMEFTEGAHSVRMWRDYFTNAELYSFDIVDMSWMETASEFGGRVRFFQGDQGDRVSMTNMYNLFGNKPFDFIIEDGSHTHEHQMICLGHLFQYVKSKGLYILEDISVPGHDCCCARNDGTYETLQNFVTSGKFDNHHLTSDECNYLEKNIKSIEFHMDIQDAYCTAIITKTKKI